MNADFQTVITASPEDQLGVFIDTAQRLNVPEQTIEKDFWVCWTLDALFNGGLSAGGPRLLFKGGTSLSKAFSLIQRFSEDIDITVFREDIDAAVSIEQLEALSRKKREARLATLRDACREYIAGRMRTDLLATALQTSLPPGSIRVELDDTDPDGQTLLVQYPSVTAESPDPYVRRSVRIECGAKSALDPHRLATVTPYVQEQLPARTLRVENITTIDAARTFWDKVIIVHSLRREYERRGELRHAGQRVSRHYYDLHVLLHSEDGQRAVSDQDLGRSCSRHAKVFFYRPELDAASPGTFAVAPPLGMVEGLRRDYAAMSGMIIGLAPDFDEVLASMTRLEALVNAQ